MARITAEEKEQKKNQYDALIFQIFTEEGWDAVTYDRLAKELGIGKSSLQRYYPSNLFFATALQGKVFPLAIQKLDLSSKSAFIQSWLTAYHDENDHIFHEVIRMLMVNIMNHGGAPATKSAIGRLIALLAQTLGEDDAKDAVITALGHTIYSYIEQ